MAQAHASPHVWFTVENNSTFYFAGSHEGKMQNFVLPAAFPVVRPKHGRPRIRSSSSMVASHVVASGFHTYNHNLITEARVLF